MDVTDVTKETTEHANKKFLLAIDKIQIAHLYVRPQHITAVWDTGVDFKELETEIFKFLLNSNSSSNLLKSISKKQEFSKQIEHTKVFLTIPNDNLNESDELIEYNLPKQYRDYHYTFKNPDKISFARYDIKVNNSEDSSTKNSLKYSFTAENPKFKYHFGKLTISGKKIAVTIPWIFPNDFLSKSSPLEEDDYLSLENLLPRIIECHSSKYQIKKDINLRKSVEVLVNFILSRKPS